jgi:phosphonate transport system ATP-binding protein
MNPILKVHQLNKHFSSGKQALNSVSLSVQSGEMIALIGASGSGKSTLLRHIAGLMPADAGSDSYVEIDGRCVQRCGKVARNIRSIRAKVGFIFQQFNLVERLPVLVNVMAGALHRTVWWRSWLQLFPMQERLKGLAALRRVGIEECYAQRASTLSGGQQQRAAIARTLVQGAQIILADEPIASLDPESSRRVMETLSQINREDNCTVIVSLHQIDFALKYCPRVIALHLGRVVFDGPASEVTPEVLSRLYSSQINELSPDANARPQAAMDALPWNALATHTI